MIRTIGFFLLLMLKIIGWALLVLLLFLLIVLLLVLFVPLRYDVLVQNERGTDPDQGNPVANLRLQLKVNWLLHLMHVSVSYGPDGLENKIRAAGVDIRKALAWYAGRKERKRKRREARNSRRAAKSMKQSPQAQETAQEQLPQKESSAKTPEQLSQKESPAETQGQLPQKEPPAETQGQLPQKEPPAETQGQLPQKEPPAKASGQLPQKESPAETPEQLSQKDSPAKAAGQFSEKSNRKAEVQEHGEDVSGPQEPEERPPETDAAFDGEPDTEKNTEPEGKRKRQRSRKRKGKKASRPGKQKKSVFRTGRPAKEEKVSKPGLFDKIRTRLGRIRKEFTDETNRHAVSRLWKELLKLLQSYKPRKLKADISFSLADPALTGKVLGLLSLLPFIYRYPCSIVPDFTSEKLYIEGEIQARGKVAVYIFVLTLLRLLRDKEFMQVVRRLMKRDARRE